MKNTWVIVAVVLLVLVGGYLGRHKIKAMFSGSSSAPVQTETMSPTPSASSSAMAEGAIMTKSGPKGDYLADVKGMTLYSYDKDTKDVSNCNAGCIKAWPPFMQASASASPSSANLTVIKRTEGTMQYSYKGMPLYYYVSDTKPGDITGDGVGGVWHLVKP